MIGIVLWKDNESEKAVIWCEDHGDLAFTGPLQKNIEPEPALEVGDVVRFDIKCERSLRIAENITMLLENWGSGLNNTLLDLPPEPDQTRQFGGAEVVALTTWRKQSKRRDVAAKLRRMG